MAHGALGVLLLSCSSVRDQTIVTDMDSYDLYAALIRQFATPEELKDTLASFVVLQLTDDDDLDIVTLKYRVDQIRDTTITQIAWSELASQLIHEFTRRNAEPNTLKGPFPGLPLIALLSNSDREVMWDSAIQHGIDYYRMIRDRFPHSHGVWEFSRVALSKTGSYALVYVAHMAGMKAGTGRLVLLLRKSGVWKVSNAVLLWES